MPDRDEVRNPKAYVADDPGALHELVRLTVALLTTSCVIFSVSATGRHATLREQLVRTMRDLPSEVFNAGRYIDRIVRTPDGLRFQSKLCVFDSEPIPNSIIYPV